MNSLLLLFSLSFIVATQAGFFRYKWPTGEGQNEGLTERLKKCDELKGAIKTFFDDLILEQVGVDDKEYLKRRIKSIMGVDFNSNRQLTRLSCKLLDVKNLQQLARVLKLPLQFVVKYYNLFKDMVREHGGPEGMARLVDLWEVTVPAAKKVGLPHWPINCSYELAYDFFANVVHDFGKGFIMDFLRPYATEKLELHSIDTFVRDLLASTSIEDFAIRVGLNPDIVQFFQKDLEIYTSDNYPFEKTMKQARAEVILARALAKFGLLDLKLRTRSKSKSRKPTGSFYPNRYTGESDLAENNNRYNGGRYSGNSRMDFQAYDNAYKNGENYYNNEYDKPYYRKHESPNRYNGNNRNSGYNQYRGSNPRESYYGGTSQNQGNDYYNRKYESTNYNRYIPSYSGKKPSQQQGYFYNKAKPSKNNNRNSKFAAYGEETHSTKGKLTQVKDDDKVYNNFDSNSGDKASDEAVNDFNTNQIIPKYITYKWNTKPKEKPKPKYIYYG